MLFKILPWAIAAGIAPLAFVAGSQALPRTETKVRSVVVQPRADWTTARLAKVFSAMQPVEVQQGEGVVQRTYANAGAVPLWAVVVLTAQPQSGPAG